MLGLGQAPVLAAGTQHGFQTLVEALLITLQLSDQAATLFQLIRTRQLRQPGGQLLLALLEALGLVIQGLHLAQLVLAAGLQGTDLPDPQPPAATPAAPNSKATTARPLPRRGALTGVSTGASSAG